MAETTILTNPYKGQGMPGLVDLLGGMQITDDPAAARALFAQCPAAEVSPLVSLDGLAAELGIAKLHAKDERRRMGLGSFKALGAAYAIAKLAAMRGGACEPGTALTGETFVCASAGNHGLSVAAGAMVFGARAVIYLSETVPPVFAELLRAKGAEVVVEGRHYEASMAAATRAAEVNGWRLLTDSSWIAPDGTAYLTAARDVMEGYLIMAMEAGEQLSAPPDHIFLQAGVGGLAAACGVAARRLWGDHPIIWVVEPEFAPALQASIAAGRAATVTGPASAMGRLDCKEPSLLALEALARTADVFLTVSEEEARRAVAMLEEHGMAASPSAVAGLAGLVAVQGAFLQNRSVPPICKNSKVLVFISEGPVKDALD